MSSATPGGRFAPALAFELRYQLRQPLFLGVFAAFFLLSFAAMASDSVQVGGGTANLDLNASFTILQTAYIFSFLGMFAATAFVAVPVVRDHDTRMAEIMFATPLDRTSYLAPRFVAGWLACLLAVSGALLGTLLGTLMPWLDPERIGAFSLAPYWHALWAVLVPNTLIPCALFFCATALTRRLSVGWITALVLIVFYAVVATNTDPETIKTTALLDPFGVIAFADATRYWTVFERNVAIPELSGTLLYSRLIWLTVAALALVIGHALFRTRLRGPGKGAAAVEPDHTPPPQLRSAPVAVAPDAWAQLRAQLLLDWRGVTRSAVFWAVLAFGAFNSLGAILGTITAPTYGTPLLPLTASLVPAIGGSFSLALLVVVVWFAGDLVHRERTLRVDELVFAAPVAAWVPLTAKLIALQLVLLAMLSMALVVGVLMQLVHGFTELRLDLWVVGIYSGIGVNFFLLAVLAVFLQAVTGNRWLGMGVLILVFLAQLVASAAGFEHELLQFGTPGLRLSDMNGWGHFLAAHWAYAITWLPFCVLLMVLAHLFWTRAGHDGWAARLAVARARLTPPVATTMAASSAAFVLLAGWVLWNTTVRNDFVSGDDREEAAAAYEQQYGQFRDLRMPDVVDLDTQVDIFPAERRLESRGTLVLRNVTDAPLEHLHYNLPAPLQVNSLTVQGTQAVAADEDLRYWQLRFVPPMQPGEERTVTYDLTWENPGFVNHGSSTRLVHNGTFVAINEIAPGPGYNPGRELQDNNTRREYDLPPLRRLPEYGAEGNTELNQFGLAARMGFRTVVSTSAGQTAIAPGYLEREWTEGDRRYFEYVMDAPIWPFVSWQSADYAVQRDEWNGVRLEVFHHPSHHWNVDRMLEAAKDGLDYFSAAFSPYQYRQFRIQEFPAYARFAQAFPNTIPFSEGIGFAADLSDPTEIDYVYYVTAHELAHQWWAHQVVGAQEQGMTVIVETLAQYSALMLMEQEYGREQMRRFLKFEGDNYLRNRGGELIEELPLKLVENQGYIHYRKGSLVMYALKDYLGEDAVNRALARFIARFGMQGPPFPRTGDLIAEFRAEADTEAKQQLITDLFEHITLWDLAVSDTQVEPLDDGRWRVTLTVSGKQLRADGEGRETEVPLAMPIDIGVFGAAEGELARNALPPALYLHKHDLVSGEQTIVVEVDSEPTRVAVDPLNVLVDRLPEDNVVVL